MITNAQRRKALGASFHHQSLNQAKEYDAVRPRYPQQAVENILGLTGASATAHVVDMGAGTGILSRQLLGAGAYVHAVEPSTAMTEVLAGIEAYHSGQLQITHQTAEHTGIPADEADIVSAAQSWHWFDTAAVQAEVARILKPQGALALIWNYLDTADATVHRLTRIMRAGDTYRPGWRPRLDPNMFTEERSTEYKWSRTLKVTEIFRYATTLSSWLAADEGERARRRTNLKDYLYGELGLEGEDSVGLPQITVLHTARLL